MKKRINGKHNLHLLLNILFMYCSMEELIIDNMKDTIEADGKTCL